MGPQKQIFLLLRTCFVLKYPLYRSRRHSCPYFGIPWACLSYICCPFTEADTILAFTSVSLGLVCLAIAPGLPKQTPFLLLLRYPLGLFVLQLLPVYRSSRHSCSYFGIPWACLSCNCSRFTEVAAILAPTSVFLGLVCLASAARLPK